MSRNASAHELAASFWDDGYAIVRELFSAADLERIEAALEQYRREVVPTLGKGDLYYEDGSDQAIKSMFRMQLNSAFFDDLSRDPRLLRIMRAIFPEGDIICYDVGFFGKAARAGSVTPPHQDNGFKFWTPPLCLKASLALDPATPANGAMWVQKGSHRLGVLPHRPSGVLGFSQTLIEPLSTQAYPEVQLCMQPGDVALHHTDCVHRSDANRTAASRRMLSFTYQSSLAETDEAKHRQYRQQLDALHASKA